MTSLGLFEAKLEAFEMRMDIKLCALFEEIRLGRSPSPRRSKHGANSDCKKNPSKIGSEDKTWQPYISTMSISFVQLQEGHLNQDAQSMRATSQPKVTLCGKGENEEKMISTQCLEKLAEIPSTDKLFLKCHIQLNQQWILMQCSLISGYFHDFTKERTMMLKVFPDDDLGSTTHDRKKKKEKDIHMTPIAMMPSISMLALPEHGNVFILGADTSRVGIDITLMQDGRLLIHTEASPTLHMRFLKGILIGTKFKIWLDTGLWHERGVSPKELQFMLTPAHAKKKWPLDKLQNGQKIEDLVFLHLQPDQ
ncbi:hypothetical protein BHM03_00000535 [Ensete ventricosum]|nr:hypothetical protein BHM03_00000535 [Ensete ventricosum]